jgi:hypothetical protein
VNKINDHIKLNTNFAVNIVKLLISFVLILSFTNIYKYINYYGLEFALFAGSSLVVAWFHYIKFSNKVEFDDSTLEVMVLSNIFGFHCIKFVDEQSRTLKKVQTREKFYNYSNAKSEVSIYISIPVSGSPFCEIIKNRRHPPK